MDHSFPTYIHEIDYISVNWECEFNEFHDNYSCLTIKTDWLTGQHSQFLQCSSIGIKISPRYFSFWKVVKLRQMLFIERQWFPIVYILFTFTSSRSSGCQIQVSMLGIFTNQLSYQRYSYLIPLRAALIQKEWKKFHKCATSLSLLFPTFVPNFLIVCH